MIRPSSGLGVDDKERPGNHVTCNDQHRRTETPFPPFLFNLTFNCLLQPHHSIIYLSPSLPLSPRWIGCAMDLLPLEVATLSTTLTLSTTSHTRRDNAIPPLLFRIARLLNFAPLSLATAIPRTQTQFPAPLARALFPLLHLNCHNKWPFQLVPRPKNSKFRVLRCFLHRPLLRTTARIAYETSTWT